MLRHDYSLSERALGLWCSLTLAILAVTSLGLRYVTRPISCWTPAHFTGAMEQYSHDVCFQQANIYNIPDIEFIRPVEKQQHTYHQWVPFALGIGAILCLLPHILWRVLSAALWLDTHTLAQTLADNQRHNPAGRHVMLKDSALVVLAGLRGGNWMLTAAALGRKMAACVVCVVQMIVIVVMFKPQLSAEDSDTDHNTKEREDEEKIDYNASLPLPRHFFCELEIRLLQNMREYSFQCTLPLAEVYSKGFTFLFYLFVVLMLCCVVDILTCVGRVAIPGLRDSSLKRYLAVSEADTDPQMTAVVQRFLDTVGMDGRLMVAVTADVCGPVAAADLTYHLWMTFKSSSRPGAVMSGPSAGPVPGSFVSTVPPHSSTAPSAPVTMASSGDPDAIPLIPMAGTGQEMKGSHH